MFLIALSVGTVTLRSCLHSSALITEGSHHRTALAAAKSFAESHHLTLTGVTCGWEPKDDWIQCTVSYQQGTDPRYSTPNFKRLKCPMAESPELECLDNLVDRSPPQA